MRNDEDVPVGDEPDSALHGGRGLVSLYGRYVLPFLTDVAMSNRVASRERARWVPRARGVVLEIGAGSGRDGPFYVTTWTLCTSWPGEP